MLILLVDEAHAEICYGEVSIMLALLNFVSEPTFVSVIKGALRFRAANNAYKYVFECFMLSCIA